MTVSEMKYACSSKYPRVDAVIRIARNIFQTSVCVVKGHDWHEDGCDAENGCSDLCCHRCGHSETIWMH